MYGSGQYVVLVDANVLYSRTLRDWVMLLALEDPEPYQIRWSEDILVETLYNLRRDHPDWHSNRIENLRQKLEEAFEGCCVADFAIDLGFRGSDPNDAHVHSAALACRADILLTFDDGGFLAPEQDPDDLPYELWKPDDFLCHVDTYECQAVHAVAQSQIRYWGSRRDDVDLPGSLRKANAPHFADRVQEYIKRIALRGT